MEGQCDGSHVGHVTGHVTWPVFLSLVFLFSFPYFLFLPSFLFLTCSSLRMPAIAFRHLICGFLNRAVPLHTVTARISWFLAFLFPSFIS